MSAINPNNPIISGSATATNGSPTITVTGDVDCSSIIPGVVLQINQFHMVRALKGTAPVSGVSTITLMENWSEVTVTGKLILWNTIEGLAGLIEGQRQALAGQTAIGGLTTTGIIERTGPNAYGTVALSTFMKTVLDDTTAAAARTTLGAQSLDATLTALAGLTTAANKGIYATAADAFDTYNLTAFGRSIGGVADATAARSLIGAGATPESILTRLRATVYADFIRNQYANYGVYGPAATDLTTQWAVTTAGTDTYNTPLGTVATTTAANIPRIEYNPANGDPMGLLCEASRTNLLRYSEAFNNAVWALIGAVTVSANTIKSPDGTINASTITDNESSATGVVSQTSQTLSVISRYTGSIYVKKGTLDVVTLNVYRQGQTESNCYFTFATSETLTTSGDNSLAGWEYIGDGWFRIWLGYDSNAVDGNMLLRVWPGLRGVLAVTGTVHLWGAQLELGAGKTSYLKTTSGQITRVFRQHVRTITDLFNKAGSTIVVDVVTDMPNNNGVNGFFGVGATTTNNLTLSYNTSAGANLIRARVYDGGPTLEVVSAAGSAPTNTVVRIALTFNAATGLFAMAVNGVYSGSNTSSSWNPSVWTQYWLGALRNSADTPIIRAMIQKLAIIPRTSTQAELVEYSKQ